MIIGVPQEIKNNENRVALTPGGAKELSKAGHTVLVQQQAGEGSGFSDTEYQQAGAELLPSIEAVYEAAEMIIKVKEPIEAEYRLVRKDQLLFTYFHFASSEPLTRAMLESGAICLAYETVELPDRSLPLLVPMSEVAGRMAIQEGAKYLEKPMQGRGILLGGVPGVRPAKVMILGGGVVGTQAAKMAAGLGADVTILDTNLNRLRYLADILPANVNTFMSNEYNIRSLIDTHDLIVGAVLIPRGQSSQAHHARHAQADAPRHRAGRCSSRSRRLHRDLSPHHPRRPYLPGRRCAALLRSQHAWCRALHIHPGPDQRDAALRAATGQPRLEKGLSTVYAPQVRAQRRAGRGGLRQRGGGFRTQACAGGRTFVMNIE